MSAAENKAVLSRSWLVPAILGVAVVVAIA